MKFWKEHKTLRIVLIAVCFAVGLLLVGIGKGKPGQMSGLLLMGGGLVLLLGALYLYNAVFR